MKNHKIGMINNKINMNIIIVKKLIPEKNIGKNPIEQINIEVPKSGCKKINKAGKFRGELNFADGVN